MSSAKALLSGADFKTLVGSVTKMPSIGAFAGSELISLEVKEGKCNASTFGVILSTAYTDAKGSFPLVGIDERLLVPFSNICGDKGKVLFELIDGKDIQIRTSGDRQITAPFCKGSHREIKPQGSKFTPDSNTAKKISYLADIAFSDSSKPELNAVYLAGDGRVVAVNQKCVALFRTDFKTEKTALPIPLARILGDSYKIFVSGETVLQNGIASYSMPSPVKALKEFPIGLIDQFEKAEKTKIGSVHGGKLMQAISECDSCLGTISRLEVVLQLNVSPGQIELTSQNGGARFRSVIPAKSKNEAQIRIPLEEVTRAAGFLMQEESIMTAVGEGGEVYFLISDGWMMFPSFQNKEKKKKK